MGYNSTATTLTLTARLTPIGRQKMISTNNGLIKTFSLGDSDANYYTNLLLSTGEVPSIAGNIGVNNTSSNSTASVNGLKSTLIVNSSGLLTKSVGSQSTNILTEFETVGYTTISGSNLTFSTINRLDYTTNSKTNLYYSFGLPITNNNFTTFTSTTATNGGYADTAFSAFATNNILVISVDNSTYGEIIDGKSLKIELATSANTYTIYSTYQNGSQPLNALDGLLTDNSNVKSNIFGSNVSMLVCDSIKTPNGGNPYLSWSTGYNLNRPFSFAGKIPYNYQTNSNLSLTADTLVGIAYLDKGMIVITDPNIVNSYAASVTSATTATTISFDSQSTGVYQIVNCIADRGEFGSTTNPTFEFDDIPRISEVGLYDDVGNLIAYAKPDRHINKNINEFLALSIKISV
jgi:hypothetical protein